MSIPDRYMSYSIFAEEMCDRLELQTKNTDRLLEVVERLTETVTMLTTRCSMLQAEIRGEEPMEWADA